MNRPDDIPAQEQWLWDNPEALAAVEAGLASAKAGDLVPGPDLEVDPSFSDSLEDFPKSSHGRDTPEKAAQAETRAKAYFAKPYDQMDERERELRGAMDFLRERNRPDYLDSDKLDDQ